MEEDRERAKEVEDGVEVMDDDEFSMIARMNYYSDWSAVAVGKEQRSVHRDWDDDRHLHSISSVIAVVVSNDCFGNHSISSHSACDFAMNSIETRTMMMNKISMLNLSSMNATNVTMTKRWRTMSENWTKRIGCYSSISVVDVIEISTKMRDVDDDENANDDCYVSDDAFDVNSKYCHYYRTIRTDRLRIVPTCHSTNDGASKLKERTSINPTGLQCIFNK